MLPGFVNGAMLVNSAAAGGGGGGPIGSYIGTTFSNANANNYSFAGVATGDAAANRVTVVAVFWELSTTDRAPSGMTLDGNAMTLVQSSHAGGTGGVAIYRIANPTGTTATIACAGSSDGGVFLAMQIAVYRVLPASGTPVDSGANSGATPVTIADVEVKNGGFLICAGMGNSNVNFTASYNGTDTPTVDLPGSTRLESTLRPCITWSINTTENATTNDPGVSGPLNAVVVAASWL